MKSEKEKQQIQFNKTCLHYAGNFPANMSDESIKTVVSDVYGFHFNTCFHVVLSFEIAADIIAEKHCFRKIGETK